MIPSTPKIAFAGLLVAAFAGSATWAISPRSQEKGAKPAASQTDEEKALNACRKVYRLERDQVVKRVAPPFLPERMADAESRFPFLKENRQRRGFPLTLIYHETGGTLQNPSMSFGAQDAKGRQLIHLIEGVAGIYAQDVEGPKELLETEVSGDFLVREEAPKAEVVAALERILWLECELKIKLTLREVERDVVVVRGKYKFKPRVEGHDAIDLYGATVDEGGSGGGTGDFAMFLDWAGRFIEPSRRFVNEAEAAPKGEISWHLNARGAFTDDERRADHDPKLVLKHLEEQTGLTFNTETRKIRVLFVEAVK